MKIFMVVLLMSCALLQCRQPMVDAVHSPSTTFSRSTIRVTGKIYPTVVELNKPVTLVYSVPVSNVIATCNVATGMGLFEFRSQRVDFEVILTHALKEPYRGLLSFGPVLPYSTVFYCQRRRINRIDLEKRQARWFCPNSVGPMIERFEVLSSFEEILAIEYENLTNERGYYQDVVKIIDFGQWSYDIVGEVDLGKRRVGEWSPWTTYNRKLFAWSTHSQSLLVWDEKGEESHDSFAGSFNRVAQKFGSVRKIIVHDSLPLAFVLGKPAKHLRHAHTQREGGAVARVLWCVTWNTESSRVYAVVEKAGTLPGLPSRFSGYRLFDMQLSPDGTWLLVEAEVFSPNMNKFKYFFAFPIDSSFPRLVGSPLILARPDDHANWAHGNAWISDPLSFVVAGGERLYKWDLEGLHEKLVEEYRAGH